jgi:hypothetical protein
MVQEVHTPGDPEITPAQILRFSNTQILKCQILNSLNPEILKLQDSYFVYTVGVTDMPGLSKWSGS